MRSWKWQESCKRDREEEVSESKEKSQSAQRGPRRRMGSRSRRWRGGGGWAVVLFGLVFDCRDLFKAHKSSDAKGRGEGHVCWKQLR